MNKLSKDNLLEILKYLDVSDIISLTSSCKNTQTICKNIFKNTDFVIQFNKIISEETIEWLDRQCINYELLVTTEIIDGTEKWYKNGRLHRDNDLPAVITSYGGQVWCKNGERHRDNDLPAIIVDRDGIQVWYKNGKLHRDHDLPAIILTETQKWWRHYELRKDNNDILPIIGSNGAQYWCQNGQLHRDNDLPAVIRSDGRQEWWRNDKVYRK